MRWLVRLNGAPWLIVAGARLSRPDEVRAIARGYAEGGTLPEGVTVEAIARERGAELGDYVSGPEPIAE